MASPSHDDYLRASLSLCRYSLITVVVFSFCINLLMLSTPIYLLQMYDRVVPNRSVETLLVLTLIVVVALIAMTLLETLRGFVLARIGVWLDKRLGPHVLSGTLARTVRKRGSSSSTQDLRNVAKLRRFVSGSNLIPLLDMPWAPVFIAVLFMLHPLIGWLTLAGALLLLGIAVINELMTRALVQNANDASNDALEQAGAILRNADAVEAMGMRGNLIRRWSRQNAAALDLHQRVSVRSGWLSALSRFLRAMLQIAVLGSAGWLILNNQLTPGALIASMLLMRRAMAPIDRAIGCWKSVVEVRKAVVRLKRRLREAPTLRRTAPFPQPEGGLSVQKLSFYYPQSQTPALHRVSFELAPGKAVGLIGSTAAGKSTLARLLVGNAAPSSGQLRLGDIDISRNDAEALGRYIGYLPQNIELFAGSIRENIARMGAGDLDAVIDAARLANVYHMIMRLPDGFETQIGEDGAVLSGGQRQRVALARAVYREPQLVVLDEPDASLDRDGRRALRKAIEALKSRGAMIVLITHSRSMLDCVDATVKLRKGRVVPSDSSADDGAPIEMHPT